MKKATASTSELATTALPSRKRGSIYVFCGFWFLFVAVSFALLGINPFLVFTEFYLIWDLVNDMIPPESDVLFDSEIYVSLVDTLAMAFLGTFFGAAFAFVLAFFAARNTSPHPLLRSVCRVLLGSQRCVPDFAIMLVIVVAVGFGPFAGALALIIGSTGLFGKFYADAIEQIDEKQVESVEMTGGSRLQVIRYGVLPQVLPSFVANTLYLFEVNVGGAIALGVFGGGGLGFKLSVANSMLNYDRMLAYILFIVFLMILVEKVSDRLRNRLLDNNL